MKKKNGKGFYVAFCILFFLTILIERICSWFNLTFGVSIEEILYTMTSPLVGADISFLDDAVNYCLKGLFFSVLIAIIVIIAENFFGKRCNQLHEWKVKEKTISMTGRQIIRTLILVICVVSFCSVLNYVNKSLNVVAYIQKNITPTYIYDEYYKFPDEVEIKDPEQPKNLIYVYLESMETSYASVEDGGCQEENYMPELTQLAKEYISFSDEERLGGLRTTTGTGWTMGALMATTSGVPFSLPIEGNSMDKYGQYATGIVALGDVLEEKGYYQEFLCGSPAEFGGRKAYFMEHGNYHIFDYDTAKEKNYIPEDYLVWWGFEDKVLYEIAKDEVLRLAEMEEPFNFTMLTVDTHHVEGYLCDLCGDEYSEQTANVVKCADSQVAEFVKWCQEQEFYKDTVIVLLGDHPRMDQSLVEKLEEEDRTMYNCFINVDVNKAVNQINRVVTPMDMFPTTLAALGFEIEGDRLALGTNLFSSRETLAEELGFKEFDKELGRHSDFYDREFLLENKMD